MPDGGIIKGMSGNISVKPQGRIEGAEKNVSGQQESGGLAKNQNTGTNKALTGVQKGTGSEIKVVRTGAEDNMQNQAKNLDSANNVADTFQTELGQNINEVV